MPRCVCAVFDCSEDYVRRFSGYIKRKKGLPFVLYAFTQKEALTDFIKSRKTDLVLLGEGCAAGGSLKELSDEIISASQNTARTALLTDKRLARVSELACVERYTSMEEIISQIIEILTEIREIPSGCEAFGGSITITGIYSFGHLDEAVNFALDLAGRGPGQKKALYVNLNRFSGLETGPDGPPAASLSDIIYYYRSGSAKIRSAWLNARRRINGIDVLTAPEHMEDLDLIADKGWDGFLKRLAQISGADEVILDMAEGVRNLETAFDMCSRIYLICGGFRDRQRETQLKSFLKSSGREDLIGRIVAEDISRTQRRMKNGSAW